MRRLNESQNDHIAQFVKGAHVLTAAAAIAIILAVVPASYVFSGIPVSQAETRIVGSVNVSSPGLTTILDDLLKLNTEVRNMASNRQSTASDLKRLVARRSEFVSMGAFSFARRSISI